MHVYSVHLHLLALAPLAFGFLLLISALARPCVPQLSLGLVTIGSWCWVIVASYLADFLDASTLLWAAMVLTPLFVTAWRGLHQEKSFLELTPVSVLSLHYISWIAAFSLLCIPIFFYLPPDTIASGRHVSNDIVGHALVARGLHFFETTGIDVRVFRWYPRGFHTVLYYVTHLVGQPPEKVFLPMLLFCYSFIVPVFWDISSAWRIRSNWILFAVSLLIATPFLNQVVVYTGFASQAAVIPLLLLTLFRLFMPPSLKLERYLLLLCALTFSCISMYTVFPLTILGLGVFIRVVLLRPSLTQVKSFCRTLLAPWQLLGYATVIVLTAPGLISMLRLIKKQVSGDAQATDVLKSAGNLKGYLSPMHLSGLWSSSLDYRQQADAAHAWLNYPQLALILFCCAVLYRSAVAQSLRGVFLTLALPVFIIPLVGFTEYVHFKYLALLVPFFIGATGLALAEFAQNSRIVGRTTFVAFVLGMIAIGPGHAAKVIGTWPTVSKAEFEHYQQFSSQFTAGGSVVVLSQDDWLRFFSARPDIFLPLIGALPTYYHAEPIKRVIVDKVANAANQEFLVNHPAINAAVQNPACREFNDARYDVFRFPCS